MQKKLLYSILVSYTLLACRDKPVDADGDGFFEEDDCNDLSLMINPDASDLAGDGIDQNCDGTDGIDIDLDGIASIASGGTDCNDEDATEEMSISHTFYADLDQDGFGSTTMSVDVCSMPAGYVEDNTDCDDTNVAINPSATEVCDGIDNDCDESVDDLDDSIDPDTQDTWFADTDMDGFGNAEESKLACVQPEGFVADDTDCVDSDVMISPYAIEVLGDGIDNDCDMMELCYEDLDDDGIGSTVLTWIVADENNIFSCLDSALASDIDTDCVDTDATISPMATEVCDDIDNDCDGLLNEADDSFDTASGTLYYIDADMDGFGDANNTTIVCADAPNLSSNSLDCDDDNRYFNPSATDFVGDGFDQNCDNIDGLDVDADGFASISSGGNDCDDNNATITATTDFDGDGFSCAVDCDDNNASIYPNALDMPEDGIDQDCSGLDSVYVPYFGNVDVVDQNYLDDFCAQFNVVYGDVTVNFANISANSTLAMDCITNIHGDLDILNASAGDSVVFDNLQSVENLSIDGGGSWSFASLTTVGNVAFNNFSGTTLDGDLALPSLPSTSSLTITGGTFSTLTGFTWLEVVDTLSITNTDVVDITAFSNLQVANNITIRNNQNLDTSSGLYGLTETYLLDIRNNSAFSESGCIFYTIHTNIGNSTVQIPGWSINSCDIDQDNSLYSSDCNDQNPDVEGLDDDNDGYSTCEGDCDDGNASIHPNATDIWYDGIDSNCDNFNDFDQDGDTDPSILFGGTDCDDTDWTQNGLDLDNDGVTSCNGDNIEPVTSCLDWLNYGATRTGIYGLLFSNGSMMNVYCDMDTAGGGWTLFAVTDADACAEDLPVGNNNLTSLTTPYFNKAFSSFQHTEFLQDMRTDGVSTDFTIQWTFQSGASTLRNRFLTAVQSSVAVNWTVETRDGYSYSYSAPWWFSDSASTGNFTTSWLSNTNGSFFSSDDGLWGANSTYVDGNAGNYFAGEGWGHGVDNSNDGNRCGYVYENGLGTYQPNLINLMYFR